MENTAPPTLAEVVNLLDSLASLVERMADVTPDDRDRTAARDIAIACGELFRRLP